MQNDITCIYGEVVAADDEHGLQRAEQAVGEAVVGAGAAEVHRAHQRAAQVRLGQRVGRARQVQHDVRQHVA